MAKKKNGKKKSSVLKTVPLKAKSTSITDSINTEVIAEALSAVNQPVLLKLCRLCETKDGPFLNIFEADKVIAKKIDDLMPFGIEENDELPHKICFRCSAKVEEFYEFVQKCVKTQDSLRKAIGNVGTVAKVKTRTLWEEKLNKSNMSNDDICDALIKKAMEGIKDIPLKPLLKDKDEKANKERKNDTLISEKISESKKENDSLKHEQQSQATKQSKMQLDKADPKLPCTRSNRSSNVEPLAESQKIKQDSDDEDDDEDNICLSKTSRALKRKVPQIKESEPEVTKKEDPKPFNIMDHISTIKVNGVGMLFQCKLCNRNFLKKDVVVSHACAKNGGPKHDLIPEYLPPIPPKVPIVKYINTKVDNLHPKPAIVNEKPIVLDDEPGPPFQIKPNPEIPPSSQSKPRPRVGPASKVKRNNDNPEAGDSSSSTPDKLTPNISSQGGAPTVQFPSIPSLNSRYKLVPGPNNTFTLVEEKVADNTEIVSSDDSNSECSKNDKDKKKTELKTKVNESSISSKKSKTNTPPGRAEKPTDEKGTSDRPYPVGLIKKVGHHSDEYTPPTCESMPFTTPAMKKHSYTIVQTGNPSKLLISTKPQPAVEEVPKKKSKRGRQDAREEVSKQPFSVTLEDTTPPKDPAFFTFINVDPLLQPSYVLPTDNIIQESQISTSTPLNSQTPDGNEKDKDNKYTCNMCGEIFSREKKLLTHIHSHYNKMDEEDQVREKTKKRGRKS